MELLDQLLFLNSIVENLEDANGRSNDIALFHDHSRFSTYKPLRSDLQSVSAFSFSISSPICCSTSYPLSSSPRGVDLRHLKLTRRSPEDPLLEEENVSDGGDPLLEERKRKCMLSNSKSARRSRTRKQKHFEYLTEEACRLKNENDRHK
ncbi:hypothetical protein RYX36_029036 [Vicia faba]